MRAEVRYFVFLLLEQPTHVLQLDTLNAAIPQGILLHAPARSPSRELAGADAVDVQVVVLVGVLARAVMAADGDAVRGGRAAALLARISRISQAGFVLLGQQIWGGHDAIALAAAQDAGAGAAVPVGAGRLAAREGVEGARALLLHGEGFSVSEVLLACDLFEGAALGFRKEEGDEGATEHEEREDLHEVVQPGRAGVALTALGGAFREERRGDDLGNDGTDLAAGGGDTVAGTTVAGGKALARYDEGRGVGSKVKEDLGEDVEGEEGALGEGVVGEADDREDDGQDEEAANLDGATPDGVDESHREPVSRDTASADEDEVANGIVAEDSIDVLAAREADGAEDRDVVQAEAVVGEIKEEPGDVLVLSL